MNVDGKDIGFRQLVELSNSIELIETMEGATRDVELRPAKVGRPTVTLQRRIAADMTLANWLQAVAKAATPVPKTCELKMLNTESKVVARFVLEDTWPTKLEVQHVTDPVTGTIVVETLTLTAQTLQRVTP